MWTSATNREKIRKGEMALVDNGQTVHPPQNSANHTVQWESSPKNPISLI